MIIFSKVYAVWRPFKMRNSRWQQKALIKATFSMCWLAAAILPLWKGAKCIMRERARGASSAATTDGPWFATNTISLCAAVPGRWFKCPSVHTEAQWCGLILHCLHWRAAFQTDRESCNPAQPDTGERRRPTLHQNLHISSQGSSGLSSNYFFVKNLFFSQNLLDDALKGLGRQPAWHHCPRVCLLLFLVTVFQNEHYLKINRGDLKTTKKSTSSKIIKNMGYHKNKI